MLKMFAHCWRCEAWAEVTKPEQVVANKTICAKCYEEIIRA